MGVYHGGPGGHACRSGPVAPPTAAPAASPAASPAEGGRGGREGRGSDARGDRPARSPKPVPISTATAMASWTRRTPATVCRSGPPRSQKTGCPTVRVEGGRIIAIYPIVFRRHRQPFSSGQAHAGRDLEDLKSNDHIMRVSVNGTPTSGARNVATLLAGRRARAVARWLKATTWHRGACDSRDSRPERSLNPSAGQRLPAADRDPIVSRPPFPSGLSSPTPSPPRSRRGEGTGKRVCNLAGRVGPGRGRVED